MTRQLPAIIFCLLVFISCQKKGIPVITERKEQPGKEAITPNIAPDTSAGKTVFMARCGRCHVLPEPSQYSAARWEGILSSMMPKARLDPEQKIHIAAWVKANAAK